jgi:hypothetical protein
VVIGNDTDSGSIVNTSGSDSVPIPLGSNPIETLKNVRLRDRILATLNLTGDASGSASATLSVSNIRLEVTFFEYQPVWIG